VDTETSIRALETALGALASGEEGGTQADAAYAMVVKALDCLRGEMPEHQMRHVGGLFEAEGFAPLEYCPYCQAHDGEEPHESDCPDAYPEGDRE
jgi:hypothetical protein